MPIQRLIFVLLFIGLLCSPAWAKVEVKDASRGFSFQLPIGFVDNPQGKNAPGMLADDIIACYTHPALGNMVGTTVLVKCLHATLPEQPSEVTAQQKDGQPPAVSGEKWKSFTLQVDQ